MMTSFLTGFLGTLGLSLVFNIRRKDVFYASIGGGLAGFLQYVLMPYMGNPYMPVFLAAFFAGIYSEILAVSQKTPATTYVIPAIVPLVPGAGMYFTMLTFAEKQFSQAAMHGSQTILIALAIACGIIIAPSVRRLVRLKKGLF